MGIAHVGHAETCLFKLENDYFFNDQMIMPCEENGYNSARTPLCDILCKNLNNAFVIRTYCCSWCHGNNEHSKSISTFALSYY